jgi:hypothetical protein
MKIGCLLYTLLKNIQEWSDPIALVVPADLSRESAQHTFRFSLDGGHLAVALAAVCLWALSGRPNGPE